MALEVARKTYIGLRGWLIPVPGFLSALGTRNSVAKARANAARLTVEERRVHHAIVEAMAVTDSPIAPNAIAAQLGLSPARMAEIITKLESMKTFLFREAGDAIDWAYPLSLTDTGHRMSADSGERFFAA